MSESTTQDQEIDEIEPGPRPRRRRSPIIDAVVSVLGIYLLVTMWGDFRYWLQSSEPVDLGSAATLFEDGVPDDLDESYVILRGTPDIQHAARLKVDSRVVSYIRIIEGGGSLFAAAKRSEGQARNQFEGVYAGRMRRLGKLRMYPWIESFFNAESIRESHEAKVESLVAALSRRSGVGLQLTDIEGESFFVGADERLGLVVSLPDAQIQLGRSSFSSQKRAEAAVAELGVPYFSPKKQTSGAFYKFYARIPVADREAAKERLSVGLEPAPRVDVSYGVSVLPTTATYFVQSDSIALEGSAISVVYGDSTTRRGFTVEGDHLVERALEDGRLSFDPASIRRVLLERVVTVDPNGYLIAVGETPSSQWMAPLMWGGVLMVVGWNLASLAWWWRRRRG